MSERPTTTDLAVVLWAVFGTVAILVHAISRLLPRALEPILDGTLDLPAALAYVAAVIGLAYSAGYRGFQRRFSPRLLARAMVLRDAPTWVRLLAPVMAMGLIHATRRRLVSSWCLVAGIVALVVLVGLLDQPWRGAVDAGVVVGLSWGTVVTLILLGQALRGQTPDVDPDLP